MVECRYTPRRTSLFFEFEIRFMSKVILIDEEKKHLRIIFSHYDVH